MRFVWGVAIIGVAASIWLFSLTETPMAPKFIQAFAHRKLQEHFQDAGYLRYEPNVVMTTGYKNRHIVSGHATAIRIGRESGAGIPTTEFQKISYALIIAVKCARFQNNCMEVHKIQVRSHKTKKPLI
jgi:hypothetical protein